MSARDLYALLPMLSPHTRHWCKRCVNASFSVAESSDFQRIAEWGAKRRADAMKGEKP